MVYGFRSAKVMKMDRRSALVLGLMLLGATSSACVSKGAESVVWLTYQQGDQISRYIMIVQTTRTVNIQSEGALASDRRPVAQSSDDTLSEAEYQKLAALFSADLVGTYESHSQPTLRADNAVVPTFTVGLDSRIPDSPVSRTTQLGMTLPIDDAQTRTMLSELNAILISVWQRGRRSGPTPGVPDPFTL